MHPVAFRDPFQRTSQPLTVVALIPARYSSTRLPGKPLADIGGRPMIEHVYRRAAQARGVDAVAAATDDARVAEAVRRFGGVVRMTSPEHRTGTDRIAELAALLECEIVVNVQGDLPFLPPEMVAAAVDPLLADRSLQMSTICVPLTDPGERERPSVVKVVRDRAGHALYFSRAPIPYVRDDQALAPGQPVAHKHIGLYAYRREFLLAFAALPPTPLEHAESLEQLRALEHGVRIRVVEVAEGSIEVDTPDDLARARSAIAQSTAPVDAASAAGSAR